MGWGLGRATGRSRPGRWIAAALAALLLAPAAANASDWRALGTELLQPVAVESQLPNASIPMALASDGRGFLWVGTQNGLARWDGLQFHIYGAGDGPGALPDSQVEALYRDHAGSLWVATTSAGLARYDARTDRFRTYAAGPGGLSHPGVQAMLDAPAGRLWVGTEAGLDLLTPATGQVRHMELGAGAAAQVRDVLASGVTALAGDARTLWIGANHGLLRRDAATGVLTLIPLRASGQTPVQTLMVDGAGRVWVGTEGAGAYVVAPGAVVARPVPGSLRAGLLGSGMRVRALLEVEPGQVWLGTYDDGVLAVDAQTLASHRVRLGNGSLLYGDQNIRALHRAPGGQVFIAANSAVTRYDPNHPGVTTLMGGEAPTAVLAERTPVSLMQDGDRLWIGYISHGLDRLDTRTGALTHLGSRITGLPDAPVRQVEPGRSGFLVATDSGLFRIGPDGRGAQRLAQPGRAPDAHVEVILRDGDRLWLGGRDGLWCYRLDGRDRLAPERATWSGPLSDRRVEVLLKDGRGRLWIGTDNGLNVLDPATGVLRRLQPPPGDLATPRGFISSLGLDRSGRLWVTTFGHGVSVAESPQAAEAMRFRRLDTADGLPNSNVNKVLQDRTGAFWASTDSGLARIDPDLRRVRVFQLAEGVPVSSFFYNAGVVTPAGDLMFGGRGGLVAIRPQEIVAAPSIPPLRLTGLRVHGREFAGDPLLGIAPGHPLRLPPGGGGLEVGFAALDYAAPERVRYAYRLLGANSQWTDADAQRRTASFTNLAPGLYTLEIRARDPAAGWPSRTLRLPLQVLPAWNQTWWFKTLEGLASAAVVVALIRWRTSALHRRRVELEAVVVERTRALQAQKDMLEAQTVELAEARVRAEATAQAKSDFLANMSHEIRTPLNGVVAVADLLTRSGLPARERAMAEIIRASGDTLQRLLSDILDMARIESGKISIETAPFHLGDMLRAVAGLSQLKCDEKGVGLRVRIAPEVDQFVLGDMVRVRQIVTNLLSNAVKFTDRGEVTLTAGRTPDGLARVEVADTGVGFAMVDKTKVLGRFEQADSSITRRFGGTGLGLSICCNLAELMGGALDCDSTPGAGSRFWIALPLEPTEALAPSSMQPEAAPQGDAGAPVRILLADDHPTNRQVVHLMLEGQAVELTAVENGAEAVDAFRSQAFDLVLMDMQMPVMDGLTALVEIRLEESRRQLPRTPAIMLTANALPEHVAKAVAAGADMHLSKPFTAAALFDAIAAVLAVSQEVQAAA